MQSLTAVYVPEDYPGMVEQHLAAPRRAMSGAMERERAGE